MLTNIVRTLLLKYQILDTKELRYGEQYFIIIIFKKELLTMMD